MTDMLLVKILFNSVISMPAAKFISIEIKDYYLNMPLNRFACSWLKLVDIPDEIAWEYSLKDKVMPDGHVYIEVCKGMYGLPWVGFFPQELLKEQLNEKGYYQSKIIPHLWKHQIQPIQFALVDDDFALNIERYRSTTPV